MKKKLRELKTDLIEGTDIDNKLIKKAERIKKGSEDINKRFREDMAKYLTTGFGLVAGLAWNDAIKTAIEHYLPSSGGGILAKFFYAVLITFIMVLVAKFILDGFLKKKEEEVKQPVKKKSGTKKKKLKKETAKKTA